MVLGWKWVVGKKESCRAFKVFKVFKVFKDLKDLKVPNRLTTND